MMSKERHTQELHQLIQAVACYSDPQQSEAVLKAAFGIAAKAHEGVQRIDKKPYIYHPLAVASILADWHAPISVVAVGLLHDLLNLRYFRGYSSKEALLERVQVEVGIEVSRLLNIVVELNSFIRHMEGSDFIIRPTQMITGRV